MPNLTGLFHLADSGDTCAATLTWDEAARTLRVVGDGVDVQVPAKSLSVSTSGDSASVHLVWQSNGRTWAVTLTDRETIRALAGLFAASLAYQLDRAILENLHATRRGRLVLTVLALLILIALGLAWLCRQSIVDFIRQRRSPAMENQIGRVMIPVSRQAQRSRVGAQRSSDTLDRRGDS